MGKVILYLLLFLQITNAMVGGGVYNKHVISVDHDKEKEVEYISVRYCLPKNAKELNENERLNDFFIQMLSIMAAPENQTEMMPPRGCYFINLPWDQNEYYGSWRMRIQDLVAWHFPLYQNLVLNQVEVEQTRHLFALNGKPILKWDDEEMVSIKKEVEKKSKECIVNFRVIMNTSEIINKPGEIAVILASTPSYVIRKNGDYNATVDLTDKNGDSKDQLLVLLISHSLRLPHFKSIKFFEFSAEFYVIHQSLAGRVASMHDWDMFGQVPDATYRMDKEDKYFWDWKYLNQTMYEYYLPMASFKLIDLLCVWNKTIGVEKISDSKFVGNLATVLKENFNVTMNHAMSAAIQVYTQNLISPVPLILEVKGNDLVGSPFYSSRSNDIIVTKREHYNISTALSEELLIRTAKNSCCDLHKRYSDGFNFVDTLQEALKTSYQGIMTIECFDKK